jgi:hypothetical protein
MAKQTHQKTRSKKELEEWIKQQQDKRHDQ